MYTYIAYASANDVKHSLIFAFNVIYLMYSGWARSMLEIGCESCNARPREHCRSSAILQLICAAIARTVIGFLKITINLLPSRDLLCVRACACVVCVCVRPTRRPHIHTYTNVSDDVVHQLQFRNSRKNERPAQHRQPQLIIN